MSPLRNRRDVDPALLAFSRWLRDVVAVPFLILGPGGVVASANAAFCERYGATRGRIEGRPLSAVPGWQHRHEAFRWALERAFAEGEPCTSLTVEAEVPAAPSGRSPVLAFLIGPGCYGAVLQGLAPGAAGAAADPKRDEEIFAVIRDTLSIGRSLLAIGGDGAGGIAGDGAALTGRINAMIAALDALRVPAHGGAGDASGLPRAVLAVVDGEADRHVLDGPGITLSLIQSLALGLVLHDIATLLGTAGVGSGRAEGEPARLSVTWRVLEGEGRPDQLRFEITRTGKGRGAPPGLAQCAFSRQLAAHALDGTLVFVSGPGDSGITCVLEFPLA